MAPFIVSRLRRPTPPPRCVPNPEADFKAALRNLEKEAEEAARRPKGLKMRSMTTKLTLASKMGGAGKGGGLLGALAAAK